MFVIYTVIDMDDPRSHGPAKSDLVQCEEGGLNVTSSLQFARNYDTI